MSEFDESIRHDELEECECCDCREFEAELDSQECHGCSSINIIEIKPDEKVMVVVKVDPKLEECDGLVENLMDSLTRLFGSGNFELVFLPLESSIEFNIISKIGDKE